MRLTGSGYDYVIKKIQSQGGMLVFTNHGHSTVSATPPSTYDYLPTKLEPLTKYDTFQATTFMLYKTEEAYNNFIKWIVLCSLEKNCIAPFPKRGGCNFFSKRGVYSGCSRFDQSVMNILYMNWHNFEQERIQIRRQQAHIRLYRFISHFYTLKNCTQGSH